VFAAVAWVSARARSILAGEAVLVQNGGNTVQYRKRCAIRPRLAFGE
jgi:hypothetical protein